MSIKESLEKIKPFYPILLIVTVSVVFFYLGRISAIKGDGGGITIDYPRVSETATVINSTMNSTSTKSVASSTSPQTGTSSLTPSGAVIGSKSGKKYYFPWCGTVKRIKPENQVHFSSIEEAKKAGFVAGGNCKGLY